MKPAERGFLLSKESYAQHLAANAVDPPEHRADLGNSKPGDGSKYLGRGLIQTVGRATYYSTSPPQQATPAPAAWFMRPVEPNLTQRMHKHPLSPDKY